MDNGLWLKNAQDVLFSCGITLARMESESGLCIWIVWDDNDGTVKHFDKWYQFKNHVSALAGAYH